MEKSARQDEEISTFQAKMAEETLRTEATIEHFTEEFKSEMMGMFKEVEEQIARQDERISRQEETIAEQEQTILTQDQRILQQGEKIAQIRPKV